MQRSIYTIIISMLLAHAAFAGGGWPQPKGSGYFKLSQYWLISDQHYTDLGQIDPNLTIGFWSTALYAEYGFTNRLTGQIYAPFFVRNYHNDQVSAATGETFLEGEALNGIGDFDVTLKYGLTKKNSKVAMTSGITLGLPFGKTTGSTLENLQLGDGEFNVLVRVDMGTSWKLSQFPMYMNVYTGFNKRTNDFSDEFRVGAELGIQLFKEKFLVAGKLNVVESLKNGIPSGLNSGASLFANNTEFSSLTIELSYSIQENWGVTVNNGIALRGENVFASPSYSVGVFWKI